MYNCVQSDRPSRAHSDEPSRINPKERRQRFRNKKVLLIDDDIGTRETFERLLRLEGIETATAGTGKEGIQLAQVTDFDLIVVDLRLTDMSGIDVMSNLRQSSSAHFVLMSAFLTVHAAVEAMKLGALEVLEKPLNIEEIVAVVEQVTCKPDAEGLGSRNEPASGRMTTAPRSIVERWVGYVAKVCDSTLKEDGGDFKTLAEWARRVGVSYSTLCETSRLLGFRPLDARDFARVLSALRAAAVFGCPPEVLLNVSNRRVLGAVSVKAGIDLEVQADRFAIGKFFLAQRFIPQSHEALRLIRLLASDWALQRRNDNVG